MNATPLYFRKLFSGAREVNYGNTVLVQRDNGEWWLGYVQDINGDYFFVDFDASTISAQWIHTKHLWPHHFLSSRKKCKHFYGNKVIQVALRRSPGEPLVFRSGTVNDWENNMFFIVNVDNWEKPDGKSPQATACHIVHRNYFVKDFPLPDDGDSFYERTTGFLYKKYVLKFPEAHLLPEVDFLPAFLGPISQLAVNRSRDPCCANCCFRRTVLIDRSNFVCQSSHGQLYPIELGCRVFVQVGFDLVTFICAEMQSDTAGRIMFWNEESLRNAWENYLAEKQRSGSVNVDRTLRNASNYGQQNDVEMSISDLPHPIVTYILLSLDINSQLQASRVCALWRLLAQKINDTGHIFFDMCTTCTRRPHDEESYAVYTRYLTYQLVTTLDAVLSGRTHTLALTTSGNHVHAANDVHAQIWMIKSLLQTKGLCLSGIIVKNCLNCDQASFLAISRNPRSGYFECVSLAELMTVCKDLVLVNYNAADAITLSAHEILFLDRATGKPTSETAFLRQDMLETRCDVFIPLLRFRSTETTVEQRRGFLAAANAHCPPVSTRVLAKVTAMHARWVQTLAYPDQWIRIRTFLRLFNEFSSNGHPQRWDAMDIRQLPIDIASLTKA
ncbi:uncharacterized protein LOC129592901 isoform X2 [Paramacrobiotus metropolitanus]|uniref:uncharacterized protein LOC129592901 isoform X2 n=1 Tax=Paramacrobiotus metropolitanus TaxID=2943436 RepID=UPI0024463CA2|nr:uncharacterized protein LOC129592901 isoform X2 [Paramacrobiotus metropolitanus]